MAIFIMNSRRFDHRRKKPKKKRPAAKSWHGSWNRLPSHMPRNFWIEIRRQLNPFTRDRPPRFPDPLPPWIRRGRDFCEAMRTLEAEIAKCVEPFGISVKHTIENGSLERFGTHARFEFNHTQPRRVVREPLEATVRNRLDTVRFVNRVIEAKRLVCLTLIGMEEWSYNGPDFVPFTATYIVENVMADMSHAMTRAMISRPERPSVSHG